MKTPPKVAAKTQDALADDVEAILSQGFDYVEILASDLSGTLFGKRYPAPQLREFAKHGLSFPRSMFALSSVGESMASYTRLGLDDGDPDIPIGLVPGSLGWVNWGDRPRAQVLVTSIAQDDLPDPRRILKRVLNKYKEAGLTPVVAFELEFTLFDGERTDKGRLQEARDPVTRYRETQGMLSVSRLDGFEGFLHEVIENCETQDIETTAICSEFAAGQFEINFTHYDDALYAADKAQLFKRTVKAVGAKHGFIATFMAKPQLSRPSNGQHIHVSVLDEDGTNIFSDGDKPADALMHAIAGLQAAAPEAMLSWAPNTNSYRRFERGGCVPTGPTWAFDHRHVAFRIPPATGNAWRIENRVPGADANCYLALAVTLAGMLVGIEQKKQPSKPTKGAPELDYDKLPLDTYEAIEACREGTVLRSIMGEDFIKLYTDYREGEQDSFEEYITTRELDWYL